MGIDAFIVSDPGIFTIIKETVKNAEIHITHLLQFPLRRLPENTLRPGTDPHAVHAGAAGAGTPRLCAPHLLGTARPFFLWPCEL